MARPARKLQRGKRTAYLLFSISVKKAKARQEFYISVKKAKASQKPATSRRTSKKRSEIRKAMSRQERKKHEKTAKHHKTKHAKKRTSGPPRGARKRQRRRQRKRVRFSRAKQPLPAFFLFMAKHRPQLWKSNPHWTAVDTVKKLGKLWHKQPERDKEMYKEKAARLRRKKQKRKAQVRA